MNTGDMVKVLSGDFQGRSGKIKARHFNVLLGEMKKIKAGVVLTGKDNETLYSVRLDREKENVYFPKSCLELIPDR
ncbi:KOW motif-containing protein [Chloroflexota bacterium]